jgi:hypothetical protein
MKPKRMHVSFGFSPAMAMALATLVACASQPQDEDGISVSQNALTSASTVTFQEGVSGYAGTTDATISESYATTNDGASSTLTSDGYDGSGRDVYSLIRWDLSRIPSNATVTAVTLTFQVSNSSTTAYPVYALNRSFNESAVTWNRASATSAWATAGAKAATDRNPTSLGSLSTGATGSRSVSLNATGIAIVNGWVATPARNYGFIVASTSNADSIVLASSEHATISYRPRITVTYTTQVNPDAGAAGGAGEGGSGGTGGASASGGTLSGGGSTATGGTTDTGGASGGSTADAGTTDAGGASGGSTADAGTTDAGGEPSPGFGFFVFSDSHVGSASNGYFSTALAQMSAITSAAGVPTIAAISLGDHTNYASGAEWGYHMALATPTLDPVTAVFDGARPRYLAAMGNHDVMNTAWYTLWNSNFPGQQGLGVNSSIQGIYFSFAYGNALFAIRDTNTATNSSTPGPQVTDLRSVLAHSSATFKFVFHHKPAFYCGNGGEGMNKASLALLDVAATANADVVFTGHSHVYSRTCRMAGSHACSGNSSGTVQLEVGSVGTPTPRALKTTAQTLTAYDASGVSRSYPYTCSTARGYDKLLGGSRTFQYVKIEGCRATLSAYQVGVATPFDTWAINHCP